MNIDLTVLFQAVIALIAALITTRLVPWLNAKTTVEQQAALRIAVRTGVYAAEQIFGGGYGSEKLAYVKRGLALKGYDVDIDAIEAAVREMAADLGCVSKWEKVQDSSIFRQIKELERDVLEVRQAENDAEVAEKAQNNALSEFRNTP